MKTIISTLLIFTQLIYAQRNFKIYDTKTDSYISVEKLAKLTQNADVIFFGEFHDDE